jgi:hypothetical protein
MLSKEQIAAFHDLINRIDMMQDSPFSDHFLNEEWVKDQIDKIFKLKGEVK